MAKTVVLFSRLLRPNIGHTLMHVALERLTSKAFGKDVMLRHIEQHRPLQGLYSPSHYAWWFDLLPDSRAITAKIFAPVRNILNHPALISASAKKVQPWIQDVNVAIACGGPNLIGGMAASAQIKLMMQHLHGAFLENGIPVLNLGIGSCYPYKDQPECIQTKDDERCARSYVERSSVLTVRDPLAQSLFRSMGYDIELVACPVLLSLDERASHSLPERPRVVINYMEQWPLQERLQRYQVHPDIGAWNAGIRQLLDRCGDRYEFVFSCHSVWEERLAQQRFPGVSTVIPKTAEDYQRLAEGAAACIAGRIHCAIPLAGAGVPGLVVGSDSRMGTCSAIGLRTAYVEEANGDMLEHTLEEMIATADNWRKELFAVKARAETRYQELLVEYAK